MFPTFRATETMTAAEQAALLRVTKDAPRDNVLYSMALGTGLRLSELLGLNVGDVSPEGREVRRRVTLDPATTKGGRRGEVFLPASLVRQVAPRSGSGPRQSRPSVQSPFGSLRRNPGLRRDPDVIHHRRAASLSVGVRYEDEGHLERCARVALNQRTCGGGRGSGATWSTPR